ncbi:hypothetical protein [Acidisoma silvae]|uniref:Glycosyl hydrolase family 30 beta sandwich domain-containing protein n=1 Tax=Acidisoma silvae TaxID=2802396 RepID=A0A963YMZ8_9PROT|nr:hypothetical protein [Acidisoma silvae]MCB8873623.1 hypothetical protein [Acidisoma silvae]
MSLDLLRRRFLAYGAGIFGSALVSGRSWAQATGLRLVPRQIFAGFGANAGIESPHVAVRDKLLHDLNAALLRVGAPYLISPGRLTGKLDTQSIYNEIIALHGAKESSLQSFADEMSQLHIKLHVIFWNAPPNWLLPLGATKHLANPAYFDDYAHYIAAHLLYFQDQGAVISAVELTNEPMGAWNARYTPEQYDQLLTVTRAALDAAGLKHIQIEGPGASSDGSPPYFQELTRTGHISDLGAYSFHEYDSRAGLVPAGLTMIRPDLAGVPAHPISITEYSVTANPWNQPPGPFLPGKQPPPLDYGIALSGEALQLVADGVTNMFIWTLEDNKGAKQAWGLIDLDGNIKPHVQALVDLFGMVAPGMKVFVPAQAVAQVPVMLFQKGSTVTLCAVNLRQEKVQISLDCSGLLPPGKRPVETRYFGKDAPMLALTADGVSLTLPPRTNLAARFRVA